MAKLIFGCGYLGSRVGQRWLVAGETVYAVTRSPRRAEQLRDAGYQPLVADVTQPATLDGLPLAETVLYAVGFDRSTGLAMRQVYVDGLRAALDALPQGTGRIVYISSTSVYGQGDGQWVDEDSPTEPSRENGRICLEAERVLREHRFGDRAVVLRLAGIYGPGRVPRRAALVAGEPIPAAKEGYLNLIHVDDAASVVLAIENVSQLPRTLLVADGQPVVRGEYYAELARLVGAPPPRFTAPVAGSPAAARATSDKRIRNDRLLRELGIELAYPSYREGLAAIVAAET